MADAQLALFLALLLGPTIKLKPPFGQPDKCRARLDWMRRSKPHRLVQRLSQGMTVRWNEATLTRAEEDERYWKEDGGVEEEGGKKDCSRTRAPHAILLLVGGWQVWPRRRKTLRRRDARCRMPKSRSPAQHMPAHPPDLIRPAGREPLNSHVFPATLHHAALVEALLLMTYAIPLVGSNTRLCLPVAYPPTPHVFPSLTASSG
ncbi:hypothetical protein BDY17DRAFT_307036 [Neohortaea acidophila]|uniref:Uncharacterized protein n=1 Tax=Neohortaea acidophila TaxID=245834 RepID=A0A6A6Q7Q4_9PEZI|nr:uncharacterized protein BDY17DRAFT_307036 [Neohortaea acidophila]KAF2487683.1 hypothetical protein BDY17DRAFT_307036 [Neohortaea acidophila]